MSTCYPSLLSWKAIVPSVSPLQNYKSTTNKFQRSSVTVESKNKCKKWKRRDLLFGFVDVKSVRKIPSQKNTIHTHLQNCLKFRDHPSPFRCGSYKWIAPYVKAYCQYNNIVQRSKMWMSKNMVATSSKLIKWVRSYQISSLLLNLCHLTNTNLVFFQVSLLKVKTCLNRRLFMKTIYLCQKNSAVLSHKN